MTCECLESLIQSLKPLDEDVEPEIIVVDNGSLEDSSQLSEILDHCQGKYIKLEENMGYCYAINTGLAQSTGEIITLCNNDLLFTKGWFDYILEGLVQDYYHVVGPMFSNCEGIQNLDVKLRKEELNHFATHFMRGQLRVEVVEKLVGACITFKRYLLNKIGGLDYWFGHGHYDDDDFCMRAKTMGYRVAMIFNSFVYHHGSVTFKDQEAMRQRLILINKARFKRKMTYHKEEMNQLRVPLVGHHGLGWQRNKEEGTLWVGQWEEQIFRLKGLLEQKKGPHYIWMPVAYFDHELQLKAKQQLDHQKDIKILDISILPKHLKLFLTSFTHFGNIEGDLINKIMKSIYNEPDHR